MQKFTGITHWGLRCKDFEACRKFYSETLELEEVFHVDKNDRPWLIYYRVSGTQFIEIFNNEFDESQISSGYSESHLCLLTDDVRQMAADLTAKGVTVWKGPSFKKTPMPLPYEPVLACDNSYSFYVSDPDGNQIEIMQFTPDSRQLQ